MSAEYAARLNAVYDSRLTKHQTAEKIGCGPKAVARGVALAGGTMRPPGPAPRGRKILP